MSNIDNLKEAIHLLKLVGNNGNDMLLEDFTDDPFEPYDNLYLAIKHIEKVIELFLAEPEYNGN